jgi:hypothetical protein
MPPADECLGAGDLLGGVQVDDGLVTNNKLMVGKGLFQCRRRFGVGGETRQGRFLGGILDDPCLVSRIRTVSRAAARAPARNVAPSMTGMRMSLTTTANGPACCNNSSPVTQSVAVTTSY